MAKTAKKLKTLAMRISTAWPAAKRKSRVSEDHDGEDARQYENRGEICGEESFQRDRERDEIGVVASIEKDGVPSP